MCIRDRVQIIGSGVDVKFDNHLPNQNELLLVLDGDRTVDLEVLAHLPDGSCRCIALEATDGLSRGLEVKSTGSSITVPVGEQVTGRVLNALGKPVDDLSLIHILIYIPSIRFTKREKWGIITNARGNERPCRFQTKIFLRS